MMMQLVIYIMIFILQGITSGVFMHLMLAPRYSQKFSMLIWSLSSVGIPFGRMIQMNYENTKPFFMIWGIVKWCIVVFLLYSDPIWKKMTSVMLALCTNIFADSILILVFYLVNPGYLEHAV